MSIIKKHGRMWARSDENIEAIANSTGDKNSEGIYVLYHGSMPVYIGIGNIRDRLEAARKSKRRGQLWDHFSWYIPSDPKHMREIEALLLNILPFYCRCLNRQTGKFSVKVPRPNKDQGPEKVKLKKFLRP